MEIIASKAGSASSSTPTEQADTTASVATCRILLGLCEGEVPNEITDADIFLDGTPLVDADGNKNFEGVTWAFRPGTQTQDVIPGFSAVESETSVNSSLKHGTPWVTQISDTELSAVIVRMSLPSGLVLQKSNGDIVGSSVNYTIEVSTDGGSYSLALNKTISEKLSSGYEISHRINLPTASTGWQIRVTRVTEDSTSSLLTNATTVEAITSVIDANLRYPKTALLYVSFNAKAFSGTPKVSVQMKGRIIRVPSNYDPDARTYSGTWDGTFKWAYSDNPAWVFMDVMTDATAGLGNRINVDMLDKWELYKISQRCDELVPDGNGGTGTEPRYTFNAYIQSQNSAWQVVNDIAAGFNGFTVWANNMFRALSDMPQDTTDSPIFTAANIIDGKVTTSGGKAADQYSSALINYRDPANHYNDATTGTMVPDLTKQFGFKQTQITAIGCTRESEAKRRGRWAIMTNYFDKVYSFQVGQEGVALNAGQHVFIADERVSGKVYGGRITAASGVTVTTDRVTDAVAGDSLKVRIQGGTVATVEIKSVSGQEITLASAVNPVPGAIFVIDAGQIKLQGCVISTIAKDDDADTYTITATIYNESKWDAVDNGTKLEIPTISSLPGTSIGAPKNLTITQFESSQQSDRVVTVEFAWDAPDSTSVIDHYEIQWRKDSGSWINAANTATRSVDVSGVYSGVYSFRVCAVLTTGKSSVWATSDGVNIVGRVGDVPAPTNFSASGQVFGVKLNWDYPDDTYDSLQTEIRYSASSDGSNATDLTTVAYPQASYLQSGLAAGVTFYYSARIVDKNGFTSAWTNWVSGTSSDDAGEILSYLTGQITSSQLGSDLIKQIDAKADQSTVDSQIAAATDSANEAVTAAKQEAADNLASAKQDLQSGIDAEKAGREAAITAEADARSAAISSEASARAEAVNQEANARADAILNEQNAREADISTVKTLIQNGDDSLAQQIAQVAAGTGDQFDPLDIWYFDDKTVDGWTASGGTPTASDDGWMTPPATDDSYVMSPAVSFSSTAYKFIKLRLKKVGSPSWAGELRWIASGGTYDNTNLMTISEPDWDANGIATITFEEIPWTGTETIGQIRLDMVGATTSDSYVSFDWIAIGRPTPGAGMAALQAEQTARVNADAAEATNRTTLATQLRGPYTGTDASQVTSGLIYSEQQLRITGDQAEATARQALETKLDNSVSEIDTSLDTLNTATKANASDISSLKSSLATTNDNVATKADASALRSLENTVTGQGNTISSQSQSITNLVNTATVGDNIIPNPNMLDNASGWGGGVESVTTLNGLTAAICGVAWQQYTPYVPVSPGDTVYLDFDIEAIDDLQYKDFSIYWFKATKGDSTSQDWFFYQTVSAGDSVHISRTLTVPEGAYYFYLTGGKVDGKFYLWNVVATRNSKGVQANASAISSLTQTVTSQGDEISSQGQSITNLQNDISGKADSSALDSLKSTVSQQGDSITSQGNSITSLQNAVSGKADNSALSALQSTVSNQGDTISSQQSSITSLQAAITQGSNIVPNPAMLGNTGWSAHAYGTDDGRVYAEGNSEWDPGSSNFSVTAGDVLLVSADLWVDSSADITLQLRFDGPSMSNNWLAVENISSPAASTWFAASGKVTVPDGATSGKLQVDHHSTLARISNPSVTVQVVSLDAFSTLQSTVTKQGDTISSQGQSITSLQNSVAGKADSSALSTLQQTVESQGETISSQGQSITSLQNSLGNKADASALSSLQSTVSQQGDAISSQSQSITNLVNTATVGDNIIPNPNMLDNASGWGGGVESVTTLNGLTAAICGVAWQQYTPYVPVSPGDTVYLDFDIEAIDDLKGKDFAIYWFKATKGDSTSQDWFFYTDVLAGNSAHISRTLTVPDGAYYFYVTGGSVGGKFYLWNVVATRNSKGVLANASAISNLSQTVTQQGNTITSQGQSITSLSSSLDGKADASAVSSLTTKVDQQGDQLAANSTQLTEISQSIGDNKTDSANLISATLTNALSSIEETSRQIVNFGSASARIDELKTTVADQNAATASTLNELSSSIDENTAVLKTKATTNFTAAGTGYSQFTVTAGVTYNGVYFSAGMGIGVQINSDGSATSQVLFVADRFAILSDEGGTPSSPFVVQNGQIFMSNAFIADGTITNAKIGDTIQSNDYNGTTGWRLSKSDGLFIGSSDSTGSSRMTSTGFGCYDSSGTERVFMGKLS